ncbi:hypothetical protein AB0C76_35840 [Kitasatospora sp. NPDC048722]|uniref:hypothetical protein n=1 Tax=Kitasatospora sp. NPDC048722 TaxID=3155639 RepID=UPI0033F882A0
MPRTPLHTSAPPRVRQSHTPSCPSGDGRGGLDDYAGGAVTVSGSTGTAIGRSICRSGDCTSGGTGYFQPVEPVLQTYGLTMATA